MNNIRKFYDFMNENGAWEAYKINVRADGRITPDWRYSQYYITDAFTWIATKEGWVYWNRLNNKWIENHVNP